MGSILQEIPDQVRDEGIFAAPTSLRPPSPHPASEPGSAPNKTRRRSRIKSAMREHACDEGVKPAMRVILAMSGRG